MSKKKNEQGTPQEQAPDLTPYIDVIRQRFMPAKIPSDATHRFSTSEVRQAIISLNPGINVSDAHTFDAMIAAGFRFEAVHGSQSLIFQWLLIEK
ncbi:MAG: 5-formyltetrahydrofolate cyclo-ligase [Bacteroidales bacterium]